MSTPLLRTKLYIPPMPRELVSRPRLFEQLSAGMERKLTLISAPAGFGKTTLLSAWAPICGRPVAWITLDEGDSDPVRFLSYLVAALQTVAEDFDLEVLSALQPPQQMQVDAVMTALINEITSLPDSFVLVLDDYHFIRSQTVHDALTFLIDHLPPQMRLVIATRADPPLPVARLRGRGQLTEMRLSDLRFTHDEIAELLNQVMGLGLSPGDVTSLASRTEGWIAGLQMAAMSMQGHKDVSGFVRDFTGSNRHILDYLVEEVLGRQPEAVQTFLLRTSILERLCGSLCDAIVGSEALVIGISEVQAPGAPIQESTGTSQRVLEYLEHANLFVVPLDDRREWYRYHRLFTDLLRERLFQVSTDLVPALHRRASEWYEANDLLPSAIDHALAGEDNERAAQLVERAAETMLMRSEITTFMGWVERLPPRLVRVRPSLCVYHAWALLLSGQPWEVVEARLEDIDGETDIIPAKAAPMYAFVALYRGQLARAVEFSRQALDQLPEEDTFLRSVADWLLGISQLSNGEDAASIRALEEIARAGQKGGNLMVAVMVLSNLAEVYLRQGNLHKARTLYERALALATDQRGGRLPIASEALKGLGVLALEWNNLEQAGRYLTEGISLSGQWGQVGEMDGYIFLARLKQAQGDLDGARQALLEAQEIARKFDATELDDIIVAISQANLCIAGGDLEAAMRWARERQLDRDFDLDHKPDDEVSVHGRLRKYEAVVLARLRLAQGRAGEALAVLDTWLPVAEHMGRIGLIIELELVRAPALHMQGNVDGAMVAVERALSLAEPGGYVRIFLDAGEPMRSLLDMYRLGLERSVPEVSGEKARRLRGYVHKLLAAFAREGLMLPVRGSEPSAEGIPDVQPAPASPEALVEPLSEREVEVLQLIAQGLSNQEVATRLYISLSTVKWHSGNIYGKLGVKNRVEAVVKARALGLLPAD